MSSKQLTRVQAQVERAKGRALADMAREKAQSSQVQGSNQKLPQLDRSRTLDNWKKEWSRRDAPLLLGLAPEVTARNQKIVKQLGQVSASESMENHSDEMAANTVRLKFGQAGRLAKMFTRPGGRLGMHRNNLLGTFNTSGPSARQQLDNMETETNELQAKISKVLTDHVDFNPGGVEGDKRQTVTQQKDDNDRTGIEDLEERLLQYRYARRATADAELPPLSRKNLAPPKPEIQAGHNIMERNAKIEHIRTWSPQAQAIRREERKLYRSDHASEVQKKEKNMRKNREARIREHLNAIDERLSPRGKGTSSQTDSKISFDSGAALWFLVLCFAQFNEKCQEDVLAKNSAGGDFTQALRFIGNLKRSSVASKKAKALERRVLGQYLGQFTADPNSAARISYIQTIFLCKVRVRRSRQHADKVWDVLQRWKQNGNLLMCMKQFFRKVTRIQSWWRRKSHWLNTIKNRVAKKWKEIERAILSVKLKKTSSVDNLMLTLGERVELGLLPDQVRNRFITHEMRFRRYMALPKIEQWAEEMSVYLQEVEDWRNEKTAARILGHKSDTLMPMPPPYVSYYPNDEEIREFCRRAKHNPKGWHPIPTAKGRRELLDQESDQKDKEGVGMLGHFQEDNGLYLESTRGQDYRTEMPSSICIYCDHRGQLSTPRQESPWEEAAKVERTQTPAQTPAHNEPRELSGTMNRDSTVSGTFITEEAL